MKTLWIMVNKINIRKNYRNALFLLVLMIVCGLAGGIVWGVIGHHFLSGVSWMICFFGYPAIFPGLFGGIIYLYNHDFA